MSERFVPSWSGSTSKPSGPPPPTTALDRIRLRFQDFGWFDLIAAVIGTLVWDMVSGLVLSGYFAIRCGGDVCTLHENLRRDQMLFWLIPLVMFLPPVLICLWRRKLRVLVTGLQVVVLGAVLIHTGYDAHVQRERINGTVPCWNNLYTPKECPWGTQ